MKKIMYRIFVITMAFVISAAGYTRAQATSNNVATQDPKVYAYYYLWWSSNHWRNKLGASYPYTASPLPLPATTDVDGCNAVSNYPDNQLLDVPNVLASQDTPGVIEADIRAAKTAGISGFWLNWGGDGTTSQTRTSVTYTPRLAEAFAASSRVGGFTNWVSYKTSSMPSTDEIINDLNFLYNEFNQEAGWERLDGKPVVTLTGSRKYGDADLIKISNAVRDRMFLVGDESGSTLTDARLALFDGLTYYWSSQNPYTNAGSFTTIKNMGDKVHAAGKRWYAPVTPGYNSALIGGTTCVPRRNGDAMRALWNGNMGSNPDGWGFISWNEIAENTHIKPMQKWGSSSLNVLSELIQSATLTPVPPTAIPTQVILPSPTATLTNTPVPPTPAPAISLDDKSSSFVYSSGWTTVSTSKAYKGSYKETTKNGATVTLAFTGQSFSIIYKGGVTFSKFDVYVDGVLVGTLNEKLAATTYQSRWDYPGQLAFGNHTLKLVFKVTSANINRGSLDAVIIR